MVVDIEKDAKDMLENARKERQAMSKKAESKGAAPASSTEKVKTEEELKKEAEKVEAEAKVKEAEVRAKKDEDILSKKDEELDEAGKKRKIELLKVKQDVEDKEKKSNVQKRFDELTAKIKDLENDRNSTKAERDTLKGELDGIKKQLSMTPDDKVKAKIKKEMSDRLNKYSEEDKELPREDRREMTQEELSDWIDEDRISAQEWITKRTLRRVGEENHLKREEFTNRKALEVMDKFDKSYQKVIQKHPELDITKRKAELEKEGKSKEETRNIIASENPKWKVFMEIFEGDINKYLDSEDGASKIAEEMEKRLEKPKDDKSNTEIEDLKKQLSDLKVENDRLQGLDLEVTSTRHAEPLASKTEIEKKTEELGESLGLSKDKVKKALERRKGVR